MKAEPREDTIDLLDPRGLRLTDIETALGLAVPAHFRRCWECRQPAQWLVVGTIASAQWAYMVYPDLEVQEFVEAVRDDQGSNFEYAVCGKHAPNRGAQ